MSLANVVLRITGRLQKPEVFIGTHCREPRCTVTGTLHEHRPPGLRARIAVAEATVLEDLATATADSDPWTAASHLFGTETRVPGGGE